MKTGGFMPFLKALVQYEKQTASSRIWTQAVNNISEDDNLEDVKHASHWLHYATQILFHYIIYWINDFDEMQVVILDSSNQRIIKMMH